MLNNLFISSEVEERRQLITLVLQNVRLDGKKIVYEAHMPFDEIIKATHSKVWRPLRDQFLNKQLEFGFSLQHIQTAFAEMNIA